MSTYKHTLAIKQWAEEDRPREKLLLKGKTALSDAELLAILIGSGNNEDSAVALCQKILDSSQHNLLELSKMSVKDLTRFKGIGEAKALSIIAAMELGRRRQRTEAMVKPAIATSRDAFDYLQAILADLDHEVFVTLYLNRSMKVIAHRVNSEGGVAGTVADVKMILRPAIEHLASFIILAHNHPSGNLSPSLKDKELTLHIVQAAKLFEVIVSDHLILGDNSYYSFADEGLL